MKMYGMHPSQHPDFGSTIDEPVWYLAHPLAPDDKFDFEQNMKHVVHVMRICFEEGVRVVAPYHTICLALDDDDPEWRRIGLELDCCVVQRIGRLICVGHRMSTGMLHEVKSLFNVPGSIVHNLVGYNDDELRAGLRHIRNGGRLEEERKL